jgi:DNA-binding transcriptional ArsR family regulator
MTEPGLVIAAIDRLVHEPARLTILSVLAACERADFLFLERATGLTRGNLSVQLSRLEAAGFIDIQKTIQHKRTLTTASLADRGRSALSSYWQTMEVLRAQSQELPTKSVRPSRRPSRRPASATT